ncbi:hypothetical protein BS50DRAFT_637833 [Corynespora cassiicola Philippines]|uniref:GST N-terminal domain-containing protein n=1 Tax=Corynespora cassiicola Philippines TaxID=1448308 RepID=A0A2T2ND22_CORCC|nr:hypothetical protein BS50DRAFT_637833 [Corynespora cassiicola Philippines]
MTIKIYATAFSTRTQCFLFLLQKLGLKYDLHNIDMLKGKHASPELVSNHHLFSRIPALDDAGTKLLKPHATARYFVAKYLSDGSFLIPTSSVALELFS